MVSDAASQRVLLFGGFANGATLSDTWEWDGNIWHQRTPAVAPSPRSTHALAYDSARRRVVLFGGSGAVRLGDTWEWDGNNWLQRSPATVPPARAGHVLAYDAARQRVVMFSGAGATVLTDTWEWDGNDWTLRAPSNRPRQQTLGAMAYDAARQRVVMLGQFDTWLYAPSVASAQTFGSGCGGAGQAPLLGSSLPYIGNLAFALEVTRARAASACVFGLSAGTRAVAIGPCTLLLQDPIIPLAAATNWAGVAESVAFTLPLDPNLRGVSVNAQAFVLDPGANGIGLTFTAGLRLVLGH